MLHIQVVQDIMAKHSKCKHDLDTETQDSTVKDTAGELEAMVRENELLQKKTVNI